MKRSLTGIRATGNIHLGNYLGAIKPLIEMQREQQCLFFIADMHSLTTTKNADALRESTLDVTACWIACGVDLARSVLYRQSDVPFTAELAWYLSCCTGMGLLEKGHAYKDALANSREVNHGVFSYPVLMAADILLYDADIVPVGKDQKQHVEMSRDMAGSFNALFGEGILKLPEPRIDEELMTIPGLDGRKMSKSYGNEIGLFLEEKEFRKKVMSIKTDSTPLEAPKEIAGTLIGQLFKLFSSPEQFRDLEQRMRAGGMGWGHAKQELADVILAAVAEPRRRYAELRGDVDQLNRALKEGAERAYEIARPVLDRVRAAVGFLPSGYSRSR